MRLAKECWSQIVCWAANEKAPKGKRVCHGIAWSRLRAVELWPEVELTCGCLAACHEGRRTLPLVSIEGGELRNLYIPAITNDQAPSSGGDSIALVQVCREKQAVRIIRSELEMHDMGRERRAGMNE